MKIKNYSKGAGGGAHGRVSNVPVLIDFSNFIVRKKRKEKTKPTANIKSNVHSLQWIRNDAFKATVKWVFFRPFRIGDPVLYYSPLKFTAGTVNSFGFLCSAISLLFFVFAFSIYKIKILLYFWIKLFRLICVKWIPGAKMRSGWKKENMNNFHLKRFGIFCSHAIA